MILQGKRKIELQHQYQYVSVNFPNQNFTTNCKKLSAISNFQTKNIYEALTIEKGQMMILL